jgi:hypothetical protein
MSNYCPNKALGLVTQERIIDACINNKPSGKRVLIPTLSPDDKTNLRSLKGLESEYKERKAYTVGEMKVRKNLHSSPQENYLDGCGRMAKAKRNCDRNCDICDEKDFYSDLCNVYNWNTIF